MNSSSCRFCAGDININFKELEHDQKRAALRRPFQHERESLVVGAQVGPAHHFTLKLTTCESESPAALNSSHHLPLHRFLVLRLNM